MPYSSVDDISSLNPSSGSSSSDESPSELSHPDDPPIHSPILPPIRGVGIGKESSQIQKSSHPVAPNLSALKEICATTASSDGLYDSSGNIKAPRSSSVQVQNASTNYLGDSCTSFEFLGNSAAKSQIPGQGDNHHRSRSHHHGGGDRSGGQSSGGEDRLLLLPPSAGETQRSSGSNKGGSGGSGHHSRNSSNAGSNAGGGGKNQKRKITPSSTGVGANLPGINPGQSQDEGSAGSGGGGGQNGDGTGRSGGSVGGGSNKNNNGDDASSTHSTGSKRKDSGCQTEKSYVKGNQSRISDFEKEIKKLLDRQHLPQVDEMASVQKVLSAMGKLGQVTLILFPLIYFILTFLLRLILIQEDTLLCRLFYCFVYFLCNFVPFRDSFVCAYT